MRICIALAALSVAPAVAAQSAPAALPVPLVTALFATGERATSRTTFSVGELPSGWPTELTLTGRTVVGGMSDGRSMVVVFADTARRPLPAFLAVFRGAGYAQPPVPGESGFMSSSGLLSYFCRDSAFVNAMTAPAPPGMTYIAVHYASAGRGACRPAVITPPPTPRTPGTLDLPTLPPPAGIRSGRTSSSSGGGAVTSRTRLTGTSVTPAELLAHYAKLLTAAGWTSSPAVSDSGGAVQLFHARDSQRNPWHGTLSVFATKTGRTAVLDMHQEEETDGMFR